MPRRSVQIQTTTGCPAACCYCPHKDRPEGTSRMTDKTFNTVLCGLKGQDLKKVCLYLQADPLTDPKLEVRLYLANNSLNYTMMEVSTNGWLATAKRAESLCRVLAQCQDPQLWVSFFGCTDEQHTPWMRLPFKKHLKRVRRLLLVADNYRIRTRLVCHHIDVQNGNQRKLFGDTIKKMAVGPTLSGMWPNSRAQNVQVLAKRKPAGLRWQDCCRTKEWLTINVWGEAILCCNDWNNEVILGDVEAHTVNEIIARIPDVCRRLEAERGTEWVCARCDG